MNSRLPAHLRRAATQGPAAAIALLGIGHDLPAVVIAVLGIILVTAVTALADHLFWLRALAQPRRDLTRLVRLTGSLEHAERLAAQLREARQDVLHARSHHADTITEVPPDRSNPES